MKIILFINAISLACVCTAIFRETTGILNKLAILGLFISTLILVTTSGAYREEVKSLKQENSSLRRQVEEQELPKINKELEA